MKLSTLSLWLTLPPIAFLTCGTCLASAGVVSGLFWWNWKIAAISALVLLVALALSFLLRLFQRP